MEKSYNIPLSTFRITNEQYVARLEIVGTHCPIGERQMSSFAGRINNLGPKSIQVSRRIHTNRMGNVTTLTCTR